MRQVSMCMLYTEDIFNLIKPYHKQKTNFINVIHFFIHVLICKDKRNTRADQFTNAALKAIKHHSMHYIK